MKFLPGFSLLDSAFDNFFEEPFGLRKQGFMKTDIHEKDGNYVFDMELPGYQKEDIALTLKDGYLLVNASTKQDKEEKDDKGNVIRKERYHGSCSRSFYVGEQVKEEDIQAKFENGELSIVIPHVESKQIEEKRILIQ